MQKPTKKIVIVGGGTAGWITAGWLAAHHRTHDATSRVEVLLVESPNTPTIGVGEGTWPTMRNSLIKMGISETDFIRECDATFKQGAKFAKWVDGTQDDFYYHPLVLPQGFTQQDLAPYWSSQQKQTSLPADKHSFSNAVCFQESVCEQGLAPKTIRTAEYSDVANYAYHLDAGKFTDFLKRHCIEKLGVTYVSADVVAVNAHANGDIASLTTHVDNMPNGDISGDLFVDCTGFSSLLLGKHYQVPFIDCSDVLFIDTALAVHVPYDDADSPIASHTISTAQDAGWIWDIGLQHRRGVGYVYASKYTDEATAMQALADYIGPKLSSLKVRKIPIHSGHRETFWHKNCVAVGLSAGFLEPLEASAIVLIELSAQMISEQLPANREVMDIVANRFNQTFRYRWDRIIDFLKLHYVLSQRDDTDFWKDNRDPATIPDSLKDLLKIWQHRAPADMDFTSNNEVFPAASYQYVLYGMGFETDFSMTPHMLNDWHTAHKQFAKNEHLIERALASLPTNRELINKIHQYGFNDL